MANRCRCGVITDYGMTCTKCADMWTPSYDPDTDDSEEVELEYVEDPEYYEDEEED